MSELVGKVALVTGGSRGIGAAIAARLAELGSEVAITYAQSKERADEVVDTIKSHGRRAWQSRQTAPSPTKCRRQSEMSSRSSVASTCSSTTPASFPSGRLRT